MSRKRANTVWLSPLAGTEFVSLAGQRISCDCAYPPEFFLTETAQICSRVHERNQIVLQIYSMHYNGGHGGRARVEKVTGAAKETAAAPSYAAITRTPPSPPYEAC